MALSRLTNWISGQVLTASALGGEFDNILNNGSSLIFPLTAAVDFNGQILQNLAVGSVTSPGLYFNGDADTGFYRSASNIFDITAGGVRSASFASVTGATSYLSVSHAAVTVPHNVTLTATGTAANINVELVTTGSGYVIIPKGSSVGANYLPGLAFNADEGTGVARLSAGTISLLANSREVLRASAYASATNYLNLAPSSTGSPVTMAPAGGDTNIGLTIDTKGTGTLTLGSADTTSVTTATGFVPAAFGGANPPAANALYQDNLCVAWAMFTGSSGTISIGHGVSSVTRHATGEYTANLYTAFSATPYGVFGITQGTSAANDIFLMRRHSTAQTTTSSRFDTRNSSSTLADGGEVTVFFMGKQ